MNLPKLPEKPSDWNIEILNSLLDIPGIERDNFEFKAGSNKEKNPVPSDIYKDFCAMANTNGGIIIVGIDQTKDEKGNVIGYKKTGFEKGKEDIVGLAISHAINNVEPAPLYDSYIIREDDKFYVVLSIASTELKKPYFTRNGCQCFVRIGSSSEPASRSTIINLFSNLNQRKAEVEKLRVAIKLVRESLLHTANEIKIIDIRNHVKVPAIDLVFLRDAAISAEWFLMENKIFGEVGERGGYTEGITSTIYKLDRLNTYIQAWNLEYAENTRRMLLSDLREWIPGGTSMRTMIEFTDKVARLSTDFIARYS
ncbi:MAG: hypothetical protein DA330_03840 [Nitrososphaera sp.]|nr:hypothetical protein [Nitrososphaera sp.]